jgi:hypothetical protein
MTRPIAYVCARPDAVQCVCIRNEKTRECMWHHVSDKIAAPLALKAAARAKAVMEHYGYECHVVESIAEWILDILPHPKRMLGTPIIIIGDGAGTRLLNARAQAVRAFNKVRADLHQWALVAWATSKGQHEHVKELGDDVLAMEDEEAATI